MAPKSVSSIGTWKLLSHWMSLKITLTQPLLSYGHNPRNEPARRPGGKFLANFARRPPRHHWFLLFRASLSCHRGFSMDLKFCWRLPTFHSPPKICTVPAARAVAVWALSSNIGKKSKPLGQRLPSGHCWEIGRSPGGNRPGTKGMCILGSEWKWTGAANIFNSRLKLQQWPSDALNQRCPGGCHSVPMAILANPPGRQAG